MKSFLLFCALSLALSGTVISGCEDGEVVPKISAYQEENAYTGTQLNSWNQSVSISSTTVVVCVNGECEVYHKEEVH